MTQHSDTKVDPEQAAEILAWAADHLRSKSIDDLLEPGEYTVQQVYAALLRLNVPVPDLEINAETPRILAELAQARRPSGQTIGSGTIGEHEVH